MAEKPIEMLAEQLRSMDKFIGTRWRHRKGGLYEIRLIALRESDLEPQVIYEDTQHHVIYTRPFPDFMDGRFTQVAGPSEQPSPLDAPRGLMFGILEWLGRKEG